MAAPHLCRTALVKALAVGGNQLGQAALLHFFGHIVLQRGRPTCASEACMFHVTAVVPPAASSVCPEASCAGSKKASAGCVGLRALPLHAATLSVTDALCTTRRATCCSAAPRSAERRSLECP